MRRRPLLLALLATLWAADACQSPAPPARVGKPGGALRYRVTSPPRTFNYLKAADDSSLIVSFYLMGGRLAEFDHEALRYVPGVAEMWRQADDGRTVELTLRDGVRFSDGQPVTAEDVSFTFRALYDERTGATAFRDAMLIGGRPIGVTVVDARRLRLVFPEPVASPENYLSNLAVLPRHRLEAEFDRGTLGDAYGLTADPAGVVTAGAFSLQSAVPGERITLWRNPHYWKKDASGKSLPYLETLAVEVISDANNAMARLGQGSLDVYDRIRPADYAALRSGSARAQALDLGPGLNTDHMWFNLKPDGLNSDGRPAGREAKRAWFHDLRFRRAVSHAIDRESIARLTLQGLATPLYGFVSPGNRAWAAADLPRIGLDPARARALLAEAGFTWRGAPDGEEIYDREGRRVEFTLIVPADSQARVAMATVVQADLARLGMKMQVAPLEFGELTRRISQSYDYDAALLGTILTEPDPSSYTNFLSSASTAHQWHPKQSRPATEWEARLDQLAAAQARERNPERRRAIFREAQLLLAEYLPVIPLVSRHVMTAADRRVGNYRPSALLPYSLWNAEEIFVR